MDRANSDTEILKRFGDRLRQLRAGSDLTQEELAAKAGFSRSYYNEIETGKRNVSLLNLNKLAHCLNVSLSELLDIR
jgi:transcriptional regulator with XRE-family HTH domain